MSTTRLVRARRTIVPGVLLLPFATVLGCDSESAERAVESTALEAGVVVSDAGSESVAALHEPRAEHCDQAELLAIADPIERFEEAFECGDELFETTFNSLDGVGANIGDGGRFTRVPRADQRGPGEWFRHHPPRATGPNGQACNECHDLPEDDGAGTAAANVIRDPLRKGLVRRFIQRNTPHLFGIGAVQLLAEEMTGILTAQREQARAIACAKGNKGRATVELSAKGVSFGELRVRCDGKDDASNVEGVDHDLVLRPLQWKGATLTVRDFNRGAGHNELGMQAVEITGDDVDGDGDGVANEFTIGDMSAMAVYIAAQPRPVTRVELADLGLAPLPDDERAAIESGEQVFAAADCSSCHRPRLLVGNPVFTEPSVHAAYRDDPFPAGQDPLARGVDPDDPIAFDLTTDLPDNVLEIDGETVHLGTFDADEDGAAIVRLYGDLKRHEMGAELAEAVDETGSGKSVWITKELWGVGSTAPYLHDGRATTLTEAILAHGGEAAASRDAFAGLSEDDQIDLLLFLDNLLLFKAEGE